MADVLASNPITSKPTDVLLPDVSKDPFAKQLLEATKAKGEMEAVKGQEELYGQRELAKAEAETTNKYAEERAPKELMEEYKNKVDEIGKPFIPTQQTAGDLGTIFAMTNILGFLIGGGAKGSAQAALSAQNGMLEGYQKGQMDVYKKQKDIFEENQKSLSKAVEGLRDELKRAAETAAVNKELGMAQARQAIANHSAQTMGQYLEKNGIAATYELSQKAYDMNEKLKDKRIQEHERARRESLEEARLAEERRHHLIEESKSQPGQLGSGAYLLKTIGVAAKSDKDNKSIVDNSAGIAGINKTIEEFRDPAIKTGIASRLTNIREAIKSLGPQTELTDEQINSLINGAVDPAGKNAVAIKDGLFNAFAIERAAQGGRVTVQMMNVGGSALNPASYAKEDYIAVLGKRRDDLYKSLHGMGLDDKQIGTIVTDLQKNPPAIYSTEKTAISKTELTGQDKEALDWANANPQDPRSAKIKQRLGVQ